MASQRNIGQGGNYMGTGGGGFSDDPYPVQFNVDYPETSNRLSVLLRIILIIPISLVAATVIGTFATGAVEVDKFLYWIWAGGFLVFGPLLMILFRQKYPRWWFDWNLALSRFMARIEAFFLLLRDEYPSTDEEQAVHLTIEYPDVENDLNRFLPLIKWILAIPHYILLLVLGVMALIVTIVAWFLILILGRYPQGMFEFVVGVLRWEYRVGAYAFLLTTDRYPPFGFGE